MRLTHVHFYSAATERWNLAEALRDLATTVEDKGSTKATAEFEFEVVDHEDGYSVVMVTKMVPLEVAV